MREKPTPAEEALWRELRNRQVAGAKFRRQHPVDHFIVDFYCAEAGLAVELDGPIRERTREADALEGLGLRFLRFNNDDVLNDMERILATIAEQVASSRSPR